MVGGGGQHYHVAGVAGTGMSAVAQVLLAQGHVVTGSDRYLDQGQDLDIFHKLRAAGVELLPQDGSAITADTRGLVVSTAIEKDNPELRAAMERQVPVVHRSQMLARLCYGKRLVAVSGTSGKSTVTGMVGWICECLGKDPVVVNGGAVMNWRSPYRVGNVRVGRGNLWIVETDESDRSFLNFDPDWAIVTNLSKDHFDLQETVKLFQSFVEHVRVGVVCGPGVGAAIRKPEGDKPAGVPAMVEEPFDWRGEKGRHAFRYKGLLFESPLIGRHNAENAFLAVVLCDQLGLDLSAVHNALASFKGIERRLECAGEAQGVTVVDEYAHNPAKISAAWRAVAERHGRVLGVWRPHGFAPLENMMEELTEAFAAICRPDDRLFLLPVYYAGGTASKKVSSTDLVTRLHGRGVKVELVENYDALMVRLLGERRAGDCALVMGARDPGLSAFARKLVQALSG